MDIQPKQLGVGSVVKNRHVKRWLNQIGRLIQPNLTNDIMMELFENVQIYPFSRKIKTYFYNTSEFGLNFHRSKTNKIDWLCVGTQLKFNSNQYYSKMHEINM